MKQVDSKINAMDYMQTSVGSKETGWLFSSKDGKESFEVMNDKATTSSFSQTNSNLLAAVYILGIKGQNVANITIDGVTPDKIAILENAFAKELKKNNMEGILINNKKVEDILQKPDREPSPAMPVAAAAANDDEPTTPRPR